jgi:5'(3')-deoxyribonucleotidase|tara:strand:- start:8395 stop:8916 length:522 start_codon:yes stop_codon:yes gene_type:complete
VLTVNFDIDGVIRNFNKSVERVYREKFPTHIIRAHNGDWDISHRFPIGDKVYDFVYKGHAWEIFSNADPYPFAIEMVSAVKKMGHRVQLVTANVGASMLPTANWITKNDVVHDSIHFTHEKELVGGDILFDDKVDNLKDCPYWAVCVNRPWNQEWEGDRVFSCKEAINLVKGA